MSFRRPKPLQPLEGWEQLEQQMRGPQRAPVDTTLLDEAPRDVHELRCLGTRGLHRLADELRIAPKPDGLMPQKEHAKAWSLRANFLANTDYEKARLVLLALQARDRKARSG